tara:strand:+ start:112 stop:288 length:177 start_codon:yes stop_codon:yes gene_type:complete
MRLFRYILPFFSTPTKYVLQECEGKRALGIVAASLACCQIKRGMELEAYAPNVAELSG